MKNKISHIGINALLKLNVVSIVIVAFCEVFALFMFFTKAFKEGIERWKFISLLAGVSIVTLLLIVSIVSLLYFLKMKNRNKT